MSDEKVDKRKEKILQVCSLVNVTVHELTSIIPDFDREQIVVYILGTETDLSVNKLLEFSTARKFINYLKEVLGK